MSAKELIEMANKAGYAVGRNRAGEYRYATNEGGQHVERQFVGKWADFCKFMEGLCK
jgi:hypothetical protein